MTALSDLHDLTPTCSRFCTEIRHEEKARPLYQSASDTEHLLICVHFKEGTLFKTA